MLGNLDFSDFDRFAEGGEVSHNPIKPEWRRYYQNYPHPDGEWAWQQTLSDTMRHLYTCGLNIENKKAGFITALLLQHIAASHTALLFEVRPVVRELLLKNLPSTTGTAITQLDLISPNMLKLTRNELVNGQMVEQVQTVTTNFRHLPQILTEFMVQGAGQVWSIGVAQELLRTNASLTLAQTVLQLIWKLRVQKLFNQEVEKRTPAVCFLSPFDQFLGGELETITGEARKYKLALLLNHDNPLEVPKEMHLAALDAAQSLVCFPHPKEADITELAILLATSIRSNAKPGIGASEQEWVVFNRLQERIKEVLQNSDYTIARLFADSAYQRMRVIEPIEVRNGK